MKATLSPQAEKKLRKLNKIDQIVLARKIRNLQNDGKAAQTEKLQGYDDTFRIRVGDYRLVYKKFSDRLYVILIGHRKDVYEILRRLLDQSRKK